MGFSRQVLANTLPAGDDLTAAMVGIGFNFSANGDPHPNIEDTLLAASCEGMDKNDFRVLAMLVTWISIHSDWVNADRLKRIVSKEKSKRVRAFWSTMGRWLQKDRRFASLAKMYRGPRIDLLPVGNAFQIKRHGVDPRFEAGPLSIPANILRDRKEDVLSPETLAKQHLTYRYRVLIGPSYRADMWAILTLEPKMSAAELAR